VFLDDMLHSQIQNLILTNKIDQKNIQQNLLLISGDGNANDNRTSFPDIVIIALNYGWTIDIWSWKASLSNKFLNIQTKYPSKIQINYLDQFRSNITFIQKQKKYQQTNYIKTSFIPFLAIFIFLVILKVYFNIF